MGILSRFRARPLIAAASAIADPGQLDSLFTATARTSADAWKIWRQVGEIHYATTQQSRLVSRCGWDVTIGGDQLEPEDATTLMEEAFGPKLGALAQQAALHLQVPGGYILARIDGIWGVYALSPDFKVKDRLRKADVLVSVTTPDPADPTRLDSPVIAAADVATELLLARAQARAQARNRTAQSGILLYPQEGVGGDVKTFENKLLTVITAPLADERSAASVVPNLVSWPAEQIEKWRLLDIGGTTDEKLHLKIEALVRQIAMILDSPPEILLGMGDVNHWSSWAIQEDNWFGHTEPLASRVGEGFAQALAMGSDTDPAEIAVTPDPAPLLQRRPATADVLSAFGMNLVSGEWARKQIGADEDDAPDAPPEEDPEIVDGEVVGEPQISTPPEATPIAAAVRPPFSTDRLMQIDRSAVDAALDLAEIAITRVSERVGAQLRARTQGDQAARDAIRDIPNEDLPQKLGVDGLPGLDQTVNDTLTALLPKRWAALVNRTYAATRAAGLDIRLDPADLDDSTNLLVSVLAGVAVDRMTGKTTDAATWTAVQRALAVAGGGADPAPPITAAGLPSPLGLGISLGAKALLHVAQNFGLVARAFEWVYGSDPRARPHPEHQALDGQVFDGEAIIENGIRWYPGDHAGCLCGVSPRWEEVA